MSKYHGKHNEWDHRSEQLGRITDREFRQEVCSLCDGSGWMIHTTQDGYDYSAPCPCRPKPQPSTPERRKEAAGDHERN